MEAVKRCTTRYVIFCHSCSRAIRSWGSVWGGGFLRCTADPVYPIDALLGFNPANGQAKVMSGRCDAAKTPN